MHEVQCFFLKFFFLFHAVFQFEWIDRKKKSRTFMHVIESIRSTWKFDDCNWIKMYVFFPLFDPLENLYLFLIAFHVLADFRVDLKYINRLTQRKSSALHASHHQSVSQSVEIRCIQEQQKTTRQIGNRKWKIAVKAHLIGTFQCQYCYFLAVCACALAHVANGHFSLFLLILHGNVFGSFSFDKPQCGYKCVLALF